MSVIRKRSRGPAKPKTTDADYQWPNGSKVCCARTGRIKGYMVKQSGGHYDVYSPRGRHLTTVGDALKARTIMR